MPSRAVVVSTDLFTRTGMKSILAEMWPDCMINAFKNLDAELDSVRFSDVDFVLIDIDSLEGEGSFNVAKAKQRFHGAKFVSVVDFASPKRIASILESGADGCIPRYVDRALFETTIGQAFFTGDDAGQPDRALNRKEGAEVDEKRAPEPAANRLTNRERDVLKLLSQGYRNDDIARQLGIGPGTTKVHVRNLRQKLGAANRTQAVIIAQRLGLIS